MRWSIAAMCTTPPAGSASTAADQRRWRTCVVGHGGQYGRRCRRHRSWSRRPTGVGLVSVSREPLRGCPGWDILATSLGHALGEEGLDANDAVTCRTVELCLLG